MNSRLVLSLTLAGLLFTLNEDTKMRTFCILFFAAFFITSANAQWIRLNTGTDKDLYSVYFISAAKGYAAGEQGTVISTLNGGKDWEVQQSGTNNKLVSLCFTDSLRGYAVGEKGTFLRTADGGISWIQQSVGTEVSLNSVCFSDSLHGLIVGDAGTILHTEDGGETWVQQASGITNTLSSVCFADGNTAYITSNSEDWNTEGIVLKTLGAGVSWQILASGRDWLPVVPKGLHFYMTSVCFTDSVNGCIVGYGVEGPQGPGDEVALRRISDSFILITTDGGVTWTETEGYGSKLLAVQFLDPGKGYAVGDKGRIMRTTDSGNLWSGQASGITQTLRSVFFVDSLTGYTGGDEGIILKTTNGGLSGMAANTDAGFIQVYPNPVNTELTILIQNSVNQCSLIVTNENGAEVSEHQIADNLLVLNVAGLTSGVYFLKFFNNDFCEVEKILKL